MRFSKPSPAMVVALVALVFAMTGTGMAAKTALIDGKKIKNKSIRGTKLAAHSITPKGYAVIAVKLPAAKKSAHTSQSSLDQSKELTTADAAATLLQPSNSGPLLQTLASNGTDFAQTTIVGPAGQAGIEGADAGQGSSARATFTSNPPVNFSKFMAITGNPAQVGAQPIDVASVMPAVATKVANVSIQMMGTWPSRAENMTVKLLVNDVGVSVDQYGCAITEANPGCVVSTIRNVPPSARLAWAVQVVTKPVIPPAVPTPVEDFTLTVGYQSLAG
jgi:hypothetical protein